MRTLIVILSASLTLSFALAEKKKARVVGVIKNGKGKVVYLQQVKDKRFVTLDSCIIGKRGKFEVAAPTTQSDFFLLKLNDESITLILDSLTTAKIKSDTSNFAENYQVSGSKDSQLQYLLLKEVMNMRDANLKLSKIAMAAEDYASVAEKLASKRDSISKAFKVFRDKFVTENATSLACLSAKKYLVPVDDIELYRSMSKGLKEKHPSNSHTAAFVKELAKLEVTVEQKRKQLEFERATAIGAVAPEIKLNNPEGETIALSSLKGKYVLIDFWASWCRPCRAENPNVVKSYNKYKDKGFTVFSVSLDSNKDRWKKAVEQDKLAWPYHVSDLKGWRTEVIDSYRFSSIPFTVLIDKEGKIIAKNLRGHALENRLARIFESN